MRHIRSISAALAAAVIPIGVASAAAITAGNPVVLVADLYDNVSNATLTIANSGFRGTPLSFSEYNASTGMPVQTIAVPSSGSTALTIDHTTTTEGCLTTTPDRSKIVFGGARYNAYTTTSTIGGLTPISSGVTRVAGTLDPAGVVDTNFTISGIGTGAVRTVASANGTSFYLATGALNQGVSYVATSGGTPVQIANPNKNSRGVGIANINGVANTLVSSDGLSSGTDRVRTYGATPTSGLAGSGLFAASAGDVVQSMAFVDLNPSVPGDDTLYLVQNGYSTSTSLTTGSNPGVQKWSFNGTSWSFSGSVAHVATTSNSVIFNNLAAFPTTTGVQLYFTSELGLYAMKDTTGHGGILSTGTNPLTTLQTLSPTGEFRFRGVAVVPEPTSLAVLGFAGLLAGRRRNRR